MNMNLSLCLFCALAILSISNARLLNEALNENLDSNENNDRAESYIRSQFSKLGSKNKRFLGSILDIFKSKKTSTYDPFMHHTESSSSYQPTYSTRSSYVYSKVSSNTHLISDDPFYKLKQHCVKNYDNFCREKKNEIYELVKKCKAIDKKAQPESCKEILSIYCYAFSSHDIFTCYSSDVQLYIPGAKKYTTASHSSTAKNSPSTRIIPVIHITGASSSSYGPFSFISKYTTRWIQPSTESTTKWTPFSTTKSTSSMYQTTKSAINDLSNPFSNGPLTAIPNDANKLKQIGQYCMKIKSKEPNCDKTLGMLRDKFKKCEKTPKTDYDCQIFKMNLCGAFPNFPCCVDILAGRTCSGTKTSIRRNIFYM